MSDRPSFVLDAHHFLHDALFNTTSVDPEIYWHRPIVVTDMRTPLRSVIGRMRVKSEHSEDDVIDNDLILVWGDQKRIITGSDLLGRLLRGIVTRDADRRQTIREKILGAPSRGIDAAEFAFDKRTQRPPADPVNAIYHRVIRGIDAAASLKHQIER